MNLPENGLNRFRRPHSFIDKCSKCGIEKLKKRSHKRPSGLWIFVDENNKQWGAKRCPSCHVKSKCLNKRKNRKPRSRDGVNDLSNRIGRRAERVAERHFLSLGYDVKIVNVNGPDLVITKNGVTKTVEVKSVNANGRSFMVGNVYKTRRGDDLIVYVYNQIVAVRLMAEHLKDEGVFSTTVSKFFVDSKNIQTKRVNHGTGLKGVRVASKSSYNAYIAHKGRQINLGSYKNIRDAIIAYNGKAIELYGEYAYLNPLPSS